MTKEALVKSIEELTNDEDIQNNFTPDNVDAELAKAASIVGSSMNGVS